ncbi:hypothetical protein [Streptomyces brasiliensis]|nr:hypothetical protein [Streptomyces brasiliensis]
MSSTPGLPPFIRSGEQHGVITGVAPGRHMKPMRRFIAPKS